MKLKDDRNWFVVMLLSIFTLGLYGIYFIHVQIRDTNIACADDGKKTGGLLKFFLLGILTFGIYMIIWDYKIVQRWQNYAISNNETPKYSIILHIVLSYILSFTGVATLISSILKLSAFNQVCRIYNNKGGGSGRGNYLKQKTGPNPADNLWGWKDSPSGK